MRVSKWTWAGLASAAAALAAGCQMESSSTDDLGEATGAAAAHVLSTDAKQVRIDGAPVFFTGYYNFGYPYHPEGENLVEGDGDLARWLDHLASHKVNLMREGVFALPTDYGRAVQPLVFDPASQKLVLNPPFWSYFHQVADAAAARKIVLEVVVWDNYSMTARGKYATNPLRAAPDHPGGFLPGGASAFPGFYRPANWPEEQRITELVVRELTRHWNIVLEPMNEPAASLNNATSLDVCEWHRQFYRWVNQAAAPAAPPLISPNLVPVRVENGAVVAGEGTCNGVAQRGFYPDPADPNVDLVSFHGTTWLPQNPDGSNALAQACQSSQTNTTDIGVRMRGRVAELQGQIGKPIILDTDALSGACSRDNNQLLWDFTRAACNEHAAAIATRDFEPYTRFLGNNQAAILNCMRKTGTAGCVPAVPAGDDESETVDEQALDALAGGRAECEQALPAPPPGFVYAPMRFADVFDYAIDGAGRGHLVSREPVGIVYARFDGTAFSAKRVLNPPINARESNLPSIVASGNRVFIVHGHAKSATGAPLVIHISSDAGNTWTREELPAPAGSTFEGSTAVAHAGQLNIFTNELIQTSPGVFHTELRRYRRTAANVYQPLQLSPLGVNTAFEVKSASSNGQVIAVAVAFTSTRVYRIAANDSITFTDLDNGGAGNSPGEPDVAIDAAGRIHVAQVPFHNTPASFWHIYSSYPTSLIYRQLGGATRTLRAFTATGYPAFPFQTSVAVDPGGTVSSAVDDGLGVQLFDSASAWIERAATYGWNPHLAINPQTGGLDIAFGGGLSGVLRLPGPIL